MMMKLLEQQFGLMATKMFFVVAGDGIGHHCAIPSDVAERVEMYCSEDSYKVPRNVNL